MSSPLIPTAPFSESIRSNETNPTAVTCFGKKKGISAQFSFDLVNDVPYFCACEQTRRRHIQNMAVRDVAAFVPRDFLLIFFFYETEFGGKIIYGYALCKTYYYIISSFSTVFHDTFYTKICYDTFGFWFYWFLFYQNVILDLEELLRRY